MIGERMPLGVSAYCVFCNKTRAREWLVYLVSLTHGFV